MEFIVTSATALDLKEWGCFTIFIGVSSSLIFIYLNRAGNICHFCCQWNLL